MTDYAYLSTGVINDSTVYFPYNPNSTYWNYDLNRQVIDTYGGRVIQLLSVSTSSMIIEGDAGSRRKLLQLYSDFKALQDSQIDTQDAATLFIPATYAEDGSITQKVWLANLEMSISKNTVQYPYRMTLEVKEVDPTVNTTIKNLVASFNLLEDGVGFKLKGEYQGIGSTPVSLGQYSQFIYGRLGSVAGTIAPPSI